MPAPHWHHWHGHVALPSHSSHASRADQNVRPGCIGLFQFCRNGLHIMMRSARSPQRGFMLMEVMSAILIFSLGVLSILQLQSVSIKQSSGAGYRATAALLANDLISRMWVSDKTPATLQSNFSSPSGASYTPWQSTVTASGLPNASSNVSITSQPGGGTTPTSSSQVTVTIYWQAPGDTDQHKYVAIAQLK